jgi:hypothetical protein
MMAEMTKRQKNNISGNYTSRGPQFFAANFQGDVYFNHANSGGQFTVFVERLR